jgi:hypothetical protein
VECVVLGAVPGVLPAGGGSVTAVLSAAELQPGDRVLEYDATVTAVRESGRHFGVLEIEFEGKPGVFHVHFLEYVHVLRSAGQDEGQDESGQQEFTEADRW